MLAYEELVRALGIEGAVGDRRVLRRACSSPTSRRPSPRCSRSSCCSRRPGCGSTSTRRTAIELTGRAARGAPGYLFSRPRERGRQAFFALPEDPELIPAIIASLVWAQGCASKFLWPIPDQGLAKRLHRVTAPTLIVFGREDRVMPAVHGEAFARLIAGSRLEMIEGCGHIPQVEELERTLALVNSFL